MVKHALKDMYVYHHGEYVSAMKGGERRTVKLRVIAATKINRRVK